MLGTCGGTGMLGYHVEGGIQDAGLPWESAHIFLTLTTASSGAHSLASAPKVPLHMGDLCLCSVSSMKDLPCAFRKSEATVNLANRGSKG